MTTYAITGATGNLGQLTVEALLASGVAPSSVVALARKPEKLGALAARGVQVRAADYDTPALWSSALAGVDRLLLVSSSEVGKRAAQHRTVIAAAKEAGVKGIAYTSLLRADTSPLSLAGEHRETEVALKASGLPAVILRNGWYTENYTASVGAALHLGSLFGAAKTGRIAAINRADLAQAAVQALTTLWTPGRTWELAGERSFTLAEFAAEISRASGRTIPYVDLSEADYAAALAQAGLPAWLAQGLAQWDACAAEGALDDSGADLRALLVRPQARWEDAVAKALPKL